jgi:plasmid stabilization system protein ParE
VSPQKAAQVLLTERALRDIAEIESYSVARWGKEVASKYIADIEAALTRLQDRPELLREDEAFHPALRFYRVNKHSVVCDVRAHAICVLTIIHASRDIPSRLAELEPTLATEVELLHGTLERANKSKT